MVQNLVPNMNTEVVGLSSTLVTATHTLKELRIAEHLSQRELAELSGISTDTILRIETESSHYGIHEGVAWALADALYVDVNSIRWPSELSSKGRRPKTGRPITEVRTTTGALCGECFTTKSLSGICLCS